MNVKLLNLDVGSEMVMNLDFGSEVPEYLTVEVLEYLTMEVPEYLTLEVPEYLTVEVPEYLTVEVLEYLVGVQGCVWIEAVVELVGELVLLLDSQLEARAGITWGNWDTRSRRSQKQPGDWDRWT
jgi:hypothetical protein